MKLRNVIWITVLLGCTTLFARSRPNFYIHTGISRPLAGPDDFKDSYRTGVNFGVMVGKQVASKFEVVGAVALHNFTFSMKDFKELRPEQNIEDFVIDGKSSNTITAFVHGKLLMPTKPGSKTLSYFFAGPGLFYTHTSDVVALGTAIDGSEDFTIPARSETVPSLSGGLGIEINIENTTLFIELGIMAGFTKTETTLFIPLKFGVAIK